MRSRRRLLSRRGERGATVVEFAMLLPLLATLLMGTIEFGRAYNSEQELAEAAREGARVGSDPAVSKSEIQAKVAASVDDATGLVVAVDPDVALPCDSREGLFVTVTVTRPITIDVLFVTSKTINQNEEASFRCHD